MRLCSVNPNGFRVDLIEKIEQMKRAVEQNQIDCILMSSPDRKQTSSNENQIARIFRAVYQNVIVNTANSRVKSDSKTNWLPGGELLIIGGKWINHISNADTYKDLLGHWHTVKIQANGRSIMIITMYRLPDRSREELNTVKVQYNKKNKVTKSAKQYRDQMIEDLSNYIECNKSGSNIILTSNMNEAIDSKNIDKFLISNGLFNIYG